MKALIIGGSGSLSGFLAQKVMKQYEVWAVTRGQRRQEGLQEQILRGEALRLVAEGIYLTQPIFVGDLADAMLDCVDKPASFQEIFCICGPDIMENRQYHEIMGELLRTRVVIEEIPLHVYFYSHPEFQG